ncbi:MAG TPA: M28 family peptidase [Acidimicrobiales bacterium]
MLGTGGTDDSNGNGRPGGPPARSGAGAPGRPDDAGVVADDLPTEQRIVDWISEVVARGIRRPGYPADVWAEDWIEQRFIEMGLEGVHREPVPLRTWTPRRSSLQVTTPSGETRKLDHFPVPYAAPVDDLDVELVAYDRDGPAAVAGKASLYTVRLVTLPATTLARGGSAPDGMADRIIDDADRSLEDGSHTVPFGPELQEVVEPSIEAGAAAFVGVLTGSPGNTYDYYVPYTASDLPIPGVWISERDGTWLSGQLAAGPVRVRLTVDSTVSDHTSYNIVGDLPGADDEVVVIGSHHDGPWASAVEDGSGIALVLAQAHYWSRRPRAERPHRLRFVLQGGHMAAGAGMLAYVGEHEEELADVVLEVHLEHAALEVEEGAGGSLVTTDRPVPRWFFTSRHGVLEDAVSDALTGERLTRSMVMAPDSIGPRPPTDGQAYYGAGVPIVNFLAAPWYLFDSIDTLDKIDRAHLVPLTRATIRIIRSTAGMTAAGMRAEPPNP